MMPPGFDAALYDLSTDRSRLDLDRIEAFLRASYWAPDRPRDVIERSVANSLCLGAYSRDDGLQVGFCRVVTDNETFGWLCDVFVDEAHRGRKLGEAMVQTLIDLPQLKGLRLLLATRDADGLYAKYGFVPLPSERIWMQRPPLQHQTPDPR